MKKIVLIVLIGLFLCVLSAQIEKSSYKVVVEKFINYYNKNKVNEIYNQFADVMQSVLPINKTKIFIKSLKQKYGRIKESQFIRYNSPFAVYKAKCINGVCMLYIAINKKSKISGISVKPYIPDNLPIMKSNSTELILPFKEKWYVVWGGDTENLNYHVNVKSQKHAFDLVILDESNKTHKNNGKKNSDYYCFGKELIAPCEGEIVLAVDGIKDNVPGETNLTFPLGNTVIIKTINNEYLYFCHFKQFSIKVKQGQKVKKGELLGLCGNSGRSTEAHLHFHVQNVENMEIATSVKCYFKHIKVNGTIKTNYSPIKGEFIKNID